MKSAFAAALASAALVVAGAVVGAPTATADPAAAVLRNIGPGSAIVVADQMGMDAGRCTLGAVARGADGRWVGLTAGHCGAVGYTVRDPADLTHSIGVVTAADNQFNGGLGFENSTKPDIEAITFDAGHALTQWVPYNGNFLPVLGTMSAADLEQQQPLLCAYGSSTGQACGSIRSIDAANDRIVINAGGAEGDSGGPVYAVTNGGVYLAGIVVSGDKDRTYSGVQLIQDYVKQWNLNVLSATTG